MARTSPLLIQLGRSIRRLRADAKYSQEGFADAVGVHRTYMGLVERGATNITLMNLERIAKTLHLRTSALLAAAENELPDKGA
jgi:transcriptional regulator with XRE-family HTH domain